jgi:hypothetical protein
MILHSSKKGFNDSSWRATINPYLLIRLVKVFYEQTSNLLNSNLLATLIVMCYEGEIPDFTKVVGDLATRAKLMWQEINQTSR